MERNVVLPHIVKEMKSLIKKILREAVGVPEGIHDLAVVVYESTNKLISKLSEINNISSNINLLRKNLKISDMEVNTIVLTVKFHETDLIDVPTFVGMGYSQTTMLKDKKLISINNDGIIKMSIDIAYNENNTLKDIKKLIKDEKNEMIASFSHELKHAYSDFKNPYTNIKDLAFYSSIKQINVDIKPIRDFLHYLYFIHSFENLVRASEIHSLAKTQGVTQENFYDFITNTRVYKMLKDIQNFSYEKLRNDLKNYIPEISKFLKNNDVKGRMNNEQKIDKFLEMIYTGIANTSISNIRNLLTNNIFEQFAGFSPDKQTFFIKLAKNAARFEGNEKNFYLYQEKMMNRHATDIIKKISKVYSLMKQQTNESIKDWDLYQKLFVKETKFDKKIKYPKK